MRRLLSPLLSISLILAILPISAQAERSGGDRILEGIFSELEQELIRDYYKGRYGRDLEDEGKGRHKGKKHKKHKKKKGLPPGLAKRETLPPGLAKQLKRKGHLPPGLEKRDLPSSLEDMLPSRRHGYKRTVIDNDVLLIEEATGLIIDILEDVF
jgi:hypothetical protein